MHPPNVVYLLWQTCKEGRTSVPVNGGKLITTQAAIVYDTLCVRHARAMERKILGSEVWQFLIFLLGILVAAVLWLFVVYLPGRTLERWEGRRADKTGPAAGPCGPDGPLKPEE